MIFGTAGHIDHGKSTLVKALTGVDPDRLPDEKARGLTLDLGYAYTELDGRRIGFVDVPGHERLVRNMLAGATGVDEVLLVVAADDGVMPQTREHLAIISLLGLARGCVVITKTDRVDAARVGEVEAQIRTLLADTPLHEAPRFPVAAITGAGLADLRRWLFDVASESGKRDCEATFRLPIDRAFTIAGAGLVITGTVHAGQVATGDEVLIGPEGRKARVRGIHTLDKPSRQALAGTRCALNLAGDVTRATVQRGHWAVHPVACVPTHRIDLHFHLLESEPRPLRHWTQVHAHLGAADLSARVAILNPTGLIAPGTTGFVQLVFDRPTLAAWGDSVVLRDQSARRTIGGGQVLDTAAPARKRRAPERLAVLAALTEPQAQARLAALLERSPQGVTKRSLVAAWGLPALRLAALAESVGTVAVPVDGDEHCYARKHWDAHRRALLAVLAQWHRTHPDEAGIGHEHLRRLVDASLEPAVFQALLGLLRTEGEIVVNAAVLRLASHKVQLTGRELRFRERVLPSIAEAGFDPPWMRDIARAERLDERTTRQFLKRLTKAGQLLELVPDLFYARASVERLARIAVEIQAQDGVIDTPRFRDEVGLGRKRAIQILEWFDHVAFTRRSGERRQVRPESTLLGVAAHSCRK